MHCQRKQEASHLHISPLLATELQPCMQVVDGMLEKQAALTPLLRSVEELVVGTATGRAPACAKFFAHWEAGLHQALHDAIAQVSPPAARGLRRPLSLVAQSSSACRLSLLLGSCKPCTC